MFSPEHAKSLATMFVENFEREYQTTKKVLAAIPPDQLDFKLGEKGRTTRELAWHIVDSDIWFAEGVAAGEFTHSEPREAAPGTTAAEILARYEALPAVLETVKAMSGEQLAKPIDFFSVFNLPAVFYLNFMANHCIHHRGQLSTYLRAMNAHVPSIYGGSADEPFSIPASA